MPRICRQLLGPEVSVVSKSILSGITLKKTKDGVTAVFITDL